MILEEFDTDKEAMISPFNFVKPVEGIPKVAVTCFEGDTFDRLVKCLNGKNIAVTKNANTEFPVYKVIYKEKEIALFLTDMGAAGAGGQLEEIYALGIEKVIIYGSCGVLDGSIEDCSIIIPNVAVRDEGLSHHYLPPSDEIIVNAKYMQEFINLLNEVGCSYTVGKTWTTDAIYRETKAKVARRKQQGCICVEMECSALAAVAQFRGKDIFQFLYAADNLDGEFWDERSLNSNVKFSERDGFGRLALELAVRIS